MPAAFITTETAALTDAGWASLSGPRNDGILGADRHGVVKTSPVTIESVSVPGRRAIVGTAAGIGVFTDRTVLVSQDGNRMLIEDLIATLASRDVWFENFVSIPAKGDSALLRQTFLRCVERCAIDYRGVRLLRSRSSGKKTGSTKCVLGTAIDRDGVRLIEINRPGKLGGTTWMKSVIDGVGVVWEDSEEGPIYEIDGPEAAICMWHLSALKATGAKPRLAFDSLQHSLFARMTIGDGHDLPLQICKTVFFSIKPCEVIKLRWEDRSWRPIVGGFLIAGAS